MKAIRLLLLLTTLFASILAHAQRWSYVYIQGDKETPFYVKLEGEMLPRYSKNYCIIPELESGPVHLTILFQQNEYPALTFTVLVPEDGFRGFLLTKKDNSFALFDIQQRFYLMPGAAGEDHLPEMIAVTAEQLNRRTENKEEVKPAEQLVERKTKEKKDKVKVKREVAQEAKTDNEPKFIDNVVLNNEHSVQTPETEVAQPATTPPPVEEPPTQPQTTTQEQVQETEQEPVQELMQQPVQQQTQAPAQENYNIAQETAIEEPQSNTAEQPQETVNLAADIAPIMNSDCPEPMGDQDFDKILTSARQKDDDERRVAYMMKKTEGNCFSTQQVFFLARELQAESMRYSFLKKAYPRVTDQHNFHLLEDHLFKTLEWKSYFRLIQ